MAESTVKLTKSFVERISEPGMYSDSDVKGFRLKVTDAGAKVYLCYGKVKGGTVRDDGTISHAPVKVTIGHHGERLPDGTILTAEKARKEAECIRGEMINGINRNQQNRNEQRAEAKKLKAEQEARDQEEAERRAAEAVKALTLGEAFEEHLTKEQKPETVKGYRYKFTKHFGDWFNKPLVEITSDAIEKRYCDIASKSKSSAAQVMRIMRAVYVTAQVRHGDEIRQLQEKEHPVKKLSHFHKRWNELDPREDYIHDSDLPAFYKAVMSLTNETARDFIMVALLTGLRKSEVCTLTWTDGVNLNRRTITVTSNHAKNKQRHMLAMSDYLHSLFLRRWQQRDDSDYVFPGKSEAGHFINPEKSIKQALSIAETKYKHPIDHFTPHTLRRTFATAADAVGYDLNSIQRLLNHKPGTIAEKHYIQRHAEKTKEPMQRINEHLLKLMKASKPESEPNNVVALSKSG